MFAPWIRREWTYEHDASVMSHEIAVEKLINWRSAADHYRQIIQHIASVCRIAPVEHSDLDLAFRHDGGDFEDAMQIASALACDAELIVTRDPSGCSKSPLPLSAS